MTWQQGVKDHATYSCRLLLFWEVTRVHMYNTLLVRPIKSHPDRVQIQPCPGLSGLADKRSFLPLIALASARWVHRRLLTVRPRSPFYVRILLNAKFVSSPDRYVVNPHLHTQITKYMHTSKDSIALISPMATVRFVLVRRTDFLG